MKTLQYFLLGGLLAMGVSAFAQYQWLDANGRSIYSDRPPPAEVPASSILSQPKLTADGVPKARPAPAVAEDKAAARKTAHDAEMTDKSKLDKRAAIAAAEKETKDKINAIRTENCRKATQAKTTLESGLRTSYVNEKGERIVMDDAERAVELTKARQAMADNCD